MEAWQSHQANMGIENIEMNSHGNGTKRKELGIGSTEMKLYEGEKKKNTEINLHEDEEEKHRDELARGRKEEKRKAGKKKKVEGRKEEGRAGKKRRGRNPFGMLFGAP